MMHCIEKTAARVTAWNTADESSRCTRAVEVARPPDYAARGSAQAAAADWNGTTLATLSPSVIGFAQILVLAASAASIVSPARAETTANTARIVGLANPASQNCVDKGGRLTLEKNRKGGQFGVCTFPDNLQCEEWAMMRGDCPAGGIKVTGFVTSAARYCAITGGAYKVTSGSNTANELGTCTFKSGRTCRATAYFDGTCMREANPRATPPAQVTAQSAAKTIQAFFSCDAGKTVNAVFTNGRQARVKLTLSDGRELSVPQAMSGSGARYANSNESFVFWNKGNTAFIEENGKTTYSACTTKR
jgi:putative hemolysin/membrane-bound inhibitor of C-type lysozyme